MAWSQAYESPYLQVDPHGRHFQVNRRVYTDPSVFELEKKLLLKRSWLYIGHVSEIAKPNDFIARQVIDTNLILTRDRDGEIRSFYNTCPHRGSVICRENAGNRRSFTCAYHGWTFKNSGELQTQNAKGGYDPDFNDSGHYNLKPVPNLGVRSGFIFVNFGKDAQPLDDYLGMAGDRIDMLSEHSAVGLEVIGGMQEYYIRANYKLMCENSYDGYHLEATHGSYLDYQMSMLKGLDPKPVKGFGRGLSNGHGCFEIETQTGRPIAQWLPVWGDAVRSDIDARYADVLERLGPTRGQMIAEVNRNMVIFPNTVMNDQQTILIRSFLPISVNEMVVRAWPLGPVDETEELRRVRLEGALAFLGPGGFATPDDVEMLELCQRGYEMGGIEWNDISKEFKAEALVGESDVLNEVQMRAYYTQYDRLMSGADERGGPMSLFMEPGTRFETRLAVEDFVYAEAALLDAWKLEDWLKLFAEDGRYEVTPTSAADPWAADPRTTLFLIGDNFERLEQRVIRLGKKNAHVEYPKSRTRHLYTNVVIADDDGATVTAMVNCCTFRTKNRLTTAYPGSIRYQLARTPDGFLIRAKRVVLDLDALIPQGKVSIIL